MKKFHIIFDESDKSHLKNSDAPAHLVDTVFAEFEDEVPTKLFEKIRKSDRYQIRTKNYKIKSIELIK